MLSTSLLLTGRCSEGIIGLEEQGVFNKAVTHFIANYTDIFGDLTEPGPFTVPLIQVSRLSACSIYQSASEFRALTNLSLPLTVLLSYSAYVTPNKGI